jgi:tRNA (guanine37-N1)-methyltransferase
MQFDILTLFPEMFAGPFSESILKRAQERGLLQIRVHYLREWASGKHKITDDAPYGGGAGMVLKPEPIFLAVEELKTSTSEVILLTPQGQPLTQKLVEELAVREHLILIAGHYEGVDERVRTELVTREISIGDYVLTGGELPAMVLVDAISRLVDGVLGEEQSHLEDSHSMGLLEYPHYTRPAEFRGLNVPEILLSGDHGKIAQWRRKEALRRTFALRPDLLATAPLSAEDLKLLAQVREEEEKEN